MEKKKLKYLFPYILLLALSFWQAYSFLKINKNIGLTIAAGMLGFLFYACLIQLSEKLFKIILIIALVLSIFYYPAIRVYGWVDFNMVASILYSNIGEAWSYITIVRWENYFRLALEIIATIYILSLRFNKFTNKYLRYGSILVLIVVSVGGFEPKKQKAGENYGGKIRVPLIGIPIRLYTLVNKAIEGNNHILQEAKKPDNWNIIDKDEIKLKKNFVIVIGESVRKDFLNCYGFTLVKNTPFINHSPHIQFNNYKSVASHTVPSLTRTIVYSEHFPKVVMSNSIIKLAKKAGYETYWLSNQGYIGLWTSPISIIASASDHYYRLSGGGFKSAKKDSDLLPHFYKILKADNHPKLIILHMMGSHPNPCRETDGKYDKFYVSNSISCYIKTIKILDSFLSKIDKALVKNGGNFNLIYFSDHGVKINDQLNIEHGAKIKQCYEVPLLIWGNNIAQTRHIKAARQGRDFIKLFCEMNNIKTSNIKSKYTFLSEDTSGVPTNLVFLNGKLSDFTKFQNNPISEFIKQGK